MEELSKIAMAHYQASSDQLQHLARDFFHAMDNDGNGKIDLREFLEFMRDEGYDQMTKPVIFEQLDLDGNDTLDCFEVMTLYYIIKSGRPFCDQCKEFISSTYLTCVGCLEDPIVGMSFYLCLDCYIRQKCDHTHNNESRFVDNYSLLEAMTKSKLEELRSNEPRSRPFETNSVSVQETPPPGLAMVQVSQGSTPAHAHHWWTQSGPNPHVTTSTASVVHNHTWIQNNYSINHPPPLYHVQYPPANNAIVPAQRQRWQEALDALNAPIRISVIGSSLCSIL